MQFSFFSIFSFAYWSHVLWRERNRRIRARYRQAVHSNGTWYRKCWQNDQLRAPLGQRRRG